MVNIPTKEKWLADTNAGTFKTRNAFLTAVDRAIADYHQLGKTQAQLTTIKFALDQYIEDYNYLNGSRSDAWKFDPRNHRNAVSDLVAELRAPGVVLTTLRNPAPALQRLPDMDSEFIGWDDLADIPVPSLPEPHLQVPPKTMTPPLPPPVMGPPPPPRRPSVGPAPVPTELSDANKRTLENTIFARLVSLMTDINREIAGLETCLVQTSNDFKEAIEEACRKFDQIHKTAAKEIDFNISLAKSFFAALESAPFPISTIGKVGGTIAGQFTTVVRNQDSHNFLNAGDYKPPSLSGFSATVQGLADKINAFKTLNVNPGRLKTIHVVKQGFVEGLKAYEQKLKAEREEQLKNIWDDDRRIKYSQILVKKAIDNARLRQPQDLYQEADKEVEKIIEGFRNIGENFKNHFSGNPKADKYRIQDSDTFASWITVLLIADYAINGLCEGKNIKTMMTSEVVKKSFGTGFAEFLARDSVGIIQIHDGTKKSKDIFASGKIPWKEGNKFHTLAVFLYLDWVQRSLNPFLLFSPNYSINEFRCASREYIHRLSWWIEDYTKQGWLGKYIKDVAAGDMAPDSAVANPDNVPKPGDIGYMDVNPFI